MFGKQILFDVINEMYEMSPTDRVGVVAAAGLRHQEVWRHRGGWAAVARRHARGLPLRARVSWSVAIKVDHIDTMSYTAR